MKPTQKWTQRENDIMRRDYHAVPAYELAKLFRRTIGAVQRQAQRLGIATNQKHPIMPVGDVEVVHDSLSVAQLFRHLRRQRALDAWRSGTGRTPHVGGCLPIERAAAWSQFDRLVREMGAWGYDVGLVVKRNRQAAKESVA